jgi:protein involved in polysaccharide export with SLBB domain
LDGEFSVAVAEPIPATSPGRTDAGGEVIAPPVFAGSNARTKGAWQQRLKLGPGDVVHFALYGRPDLTRTDVSVEPDGRISYLEAQGIIATGLTIDELREVVTAELSKSLKRPHVIVTPGAFKSKKFFVLGKVVNKGAFVLDRPRTVLEAIAMASGLETGMFQQNTVELADLPRSFLIRNGRRVPLDFEKLFLHGDLSQNILMEPDDYMYFPSATASEIYVLGAVKSPGVQGLTAGASVLSVITLAGGWGEKAWQQRVLVVRGSISEPKRIIVNMADILSAKEKDFLLEPRDIVYVANRPWARVEELTDMATTAFIQTMFTVWTGGNVGPLLKQPILPTLK